VFGTLNAIGTVDSKIIFDNVNIVPGNGGSSQQFNLNIDFAEITSGGIYYPTGNAIYGKISLKNSVLTNIGYMYIWYPVANSYIEKNIFINSGGISVGLSGGNSVTISNNAFYGSTGDNGTVYAIKNWASYATSELIVLNNSFLNTDRVALMLQYSHSKMTAINNFWSTTNTSVIDTMIYDKSDDLSLPAYITYAPYLTAENLNTPDATPYIP